MTIKYLVLTTLLSLILSCSQDKIVPFSELAEGSPAITGKPEYLASPYVTAGDRVYMIGHQDGSFPELGWHIKGEMGGVWDHPIKLMDGFKIDILTDTGIVYLDKADAFVNYPFGNKLVFTLDSLDLKIERWQFVPDGKEGLVIQLFLENKSDLKKEISMQFTGMVDLRPTWLGERSGMIDAEDLIHYDQTVNGWIAKDKNNPWFVIFGSDKPSEYDEVVINQYSGMGKAASLRRKITLEAKSSKSINYYISGSYHSELEAMETYKELSGNNATYFIQKKQRYKSLANKSKLTVPDRDIEQTFEWLKYNADWLIRTVPEVGSGIAAGLPDYPWWFGVDSEYALQGYMMIGQREPVYSTIKLLDSVSNAINGNGRIIHEMSTNGAVFNEGNINETPQFASLIWKIYLWNGDSAFLRKYFPTVKKGLNWLMTEKDADGNMFPDGFGMMEIHGMDSEMIDVAAYTQKAFQDAAEMAKLMNELELSEKYSAIAGELKQKINTQFWSEEYNSYADFIGTDQQALRLIEDAIIRADTLNKPWAVAELKLTKQSIQKNPSDVGRPFVLHHNWVVNTPMEVGLADREKAIRALNTAEKYVNPFGVFVTGIDRDESAGSDEGSFRGSKIFSYTGAVMTLPTGVQAISENNYGRPDQALNYLKRMTRTFSYALPGSMYEVSPDYGMVTQAWNIYGYAIPIVEQFFGIRPDAANKTIIIRPQMPSEWKNASLEHVPVGDNEISVYFSEENGEQYIRVEQTRSDWQLELELPKSDTSKVSGKKGKSEVIDEMANSYYSVISHEKSFEVIFKK